MPEPKKVKDTEDDSSFEADEEPIKPKQVRQTEELPEEQEADQDDEAVEGEFTELIPDCDGPEGTMFSLTLLTYANEEGDGNEHDISLTIDNATIELPLDDFIALLAEIRPIEPDLRRLSKG